VGFGGGATTSVTSGSRVIAVVDGEHHPAVVRDELERLAREHRTAHGIAAHCISHDLSVPGAARVLWERIARQGIVIDIVVNNAGIGLYGPLHEQSPEAIDSLVQINIAALTSLTRLAVPGMVERGWGRIIFISTSLDTMLDPSHVAYGMTKASDVWLTQDVPPNSIVTEATARNKPSPS
jgi:short-subunit dehydrogenase